MFEGGHKRGILVVMQGVDQSLKIERRSTTIAKRRGKLNLSATSCRIRKRELPLIRRENNRIIPVKLVLRKRTTMMENYLSFLMAVPNLVRIGSLILLVRFICVPIGTGFQHMK